MIETLAKDQFIDALHEDNLSLKLRQSRLGTLHQTLELESYQLAVSNM